MPTILNKEKSQEKTDGICAERKQQSFVNGNFQCDGIEQGFNQPGEYFGNDDELTAVFDEFGEEKPDIGQSKAGGKDCYCNKCRITGLNFEPFAEEKFLRAGDDGFDCYRHGERPDE